MSGFNAKEAIVFKFDNSNITSDAGKKNKQLQAIITITYTSATGVKSITAQNSEAKTRATKKVIVNGRFLILKDNKAYNAVGQELTK